MNDTVKGSLLRGHDVMEVYEIYVIQNLGERDIKIRVGMLYGVKGLAGDDVMGASNYEHFFLNTSCRAKLHSA